MHESTRAVARGLGARSSAIDPPRSSIDSDLRAPRERSRRRAGRCELIAARHLVDGRSRIADAITCDARVDAGGRARARRSNISARLRRAASGWRPWSESVTPLEHGTRPSLRSRVGGALDLHAARLRSQPPAFAFAAHERSGHAVQINVWPDPRPIAWCRSSEEVERSSGSTAAGGLDASSTTTMSVVRCRGRATRLRRPPRTCHVARLSAGPFAPGARRRGCTMIR